MSDTTQGTAAVVELTPEAAEKAREFLAEESLAPKSGGLRVSVLPGGCSGFQYGLNLEEEAREDDDVDEAGLVLEGHEDDAPFAGGALPNDAEAGDLDAGAGAAGREVAGGADAAAAQAWR